MNIKSKQNTLTQTAPRFAYLDIAKAIGIIAVVFAHINVKGPVYQVFYSFHIPLFFILAGMTFKGETQRFGEFIYKKAKRLLVPYLSYSLITFAWYALVEVKMPEFTALTRGQTTLGAFIEIFLARGSVYFLQHNPALWFIPCLFVAEVLYFGLAKCKRPVKIIGGILLGVMGYIFTLDFMPDIFRELPWQAGVSLLAIPFMLFGHEMTKIFGLDGLQKAFVKVKALSWVLVIVGICAVIALTFVNSNIVYKAEVQKAEAEYAQKLEEGDTEAVMTKVYEDKAHVSMGQKELGNPGIFYVNAIIGSLTVLVFSALVADLMPSRIALHKSWLVWLGERSYAIMAIHFPVKRRMVVIVAQAINAWHLAEVKGGYTTFTSNRILPSLIAFIFTMIFTVIITISAEAFAENATLPGKGK